MIFPATACILGLKTVPDPGSSNGKLENGLSDWFSEWSKLCNTACLDGVFKNSFGKLLF